MKTFFSLAIPAAFLLALTSCNKDYTCECTSTVTEPGVTYQGFTHPGSSSTSTSTRTIKDKEGSAKSECEKGTDSTYTDSQYASLGQGQTSTIVTCSIK